MDLLSTGKEHLPPPTMTPVLIYLPDLEYSMKSLFKRCVQCEQGVPSCPNCAADETCSFQVKTCDKCAFTTCVKKPTVGGSGSSSNATTAAGPIAGGVVGGIVVIGLMVFLVWRFCIKKRKAAYVNEWDDNDGVEKGGLDQFSMHRDRRASTHTVASLASTVYTRASNIIQIAYIPGVTNRSVHSTPDLVPPVPPIPAASAPVSHHNSPHIGEDQHFFLPSDLRNSTFSGFSDRSSMARSVNRSSVATTIYRNNAIVSPVPAQAVTRMKPATVSVKSSSKNSPNISRSTTPPMPSLSPQQALNTKSSIVGKVGMPKAITVTRKNPNQIYELDGSGSERSVPFATPPERKGTTSPYSHRSNFDDASSDEEGAVNNGSKQRLMGIRQSDATTVFHDESPVTPGATPRAFSKFNPDSPSRKDNNTSLNQIIEEATRKASHDPLHGGLGAYNQPEQSPFSDRHAARTP